jgi:carbon-monoxide dehydrogenase large subunit
LNAWAFERIVSVITFQTTLPDLPDSRRVVFATARARWWPAVRRCKLIDKGKWLAGHLLEAAEADLEFADGKFMVVGTDRNVSLAQVARTSFQPARLPPGMEPGFYENATYAPERATFPTGCHVCEAEIDPETGAVSLVGYVVVDDVGTVINPLTLKGQVHGSPGA